MSLSIGEERGRSYPILTCDTCGEPIEDFALAIVTFPRTTGNALVAVQGVYHKGTCDPDSPKRGRGSEKKHRYWMPLTQYLSWLLWNHNFGKKKVTGEKRQLVIGVSPMIDL